MIPPALSDSPSASPSATATDPAVAALIAAQRRELVNRRRWTIAARLTSLSFATWYLVLLIGLGRDAPFYLLLSIFAVVTGLSGLVIANYFDPPLLLRNLHRPHTATAANWTALQALRRELLPPLVQDLGVPEGPERDALIADAGADELVRRTAAKMRGDRRRFGRIYLSVYLVVAAALVALVCTYTPAP
jgi:hypothetical protein